MGFSGLVVSQQVAHFRFVMSHSVEGLNHAPPPARCSSAKPCHSHPSPPAARLGLWQSGTALPGGAISARHRVNQNSALRSHEMIGRLSTSTEEFLTNDWSTAAAILPAGLLQAPEGLNSP